MTTPEDLTPIHVLFMGERVAKGARYQTFAPVQEDGSLDAEMWFAWKSSGPKIVGGVFSGASISADRKSIAGLDRLRFVRKHPEQGDVLRWQALHDAAQEELAATRLEKAARGSDFERIMLPLRREYEKITRRHDMATAAAFERAVLNALRNKPRADE